MCLCRVCDRCCVFCLCSCMGSVSVRMQMLYVCVLCVCCGSSQCCVLHDLQFVNAGQGCKRRPYGRGILQSRSLNCLVGSPMCVPFCLPHPVAVSDFIIYRGMCTSTEMLWICVLYVSLRFKISLRIFWFVAMCSVVLFILRSRLLLYSTGSGVNRVQVVLSGFNIRLFCFMRAKTLCRYVCMYFLAALRVCVGVMMMSSA